MPAVKFFARLDLDQTFMFLDEHDVPKGSWPGGWLIGYRFDRTAAAEAGTGLRCAIFMGGRPDLV
jgi:hypothetical protein